MHTAFFIHALLSRQLTVKQLAPSRALDASQGCAIPQTEWRHAECLLLCIHFCLQEAKAAQAALQKYKGVAQGMDEVFCLGPFAVGLFHTRS